MEDILKDKRFCHIVSDPRYKRIPKLERKVKIDKRFQSMFNDKRFTVKYTVDKRGRPVTNSTTEDLRRYYAVSSDSHSDYEEETGEGSENINVPSLKINTNKSKVVKKIHRKNKISLGRNHYSDTSDHSVSDENTLTRTEQRCKVLKVKPVKHKDEMDSRLDSDDSVGSEETADWSDSLQLRAEERLQVNDKAKAKLQDLTVDYARGEGVLTSSSSEDEESEEEFDDELDHGWGELDQTADQTDSATHRLALCNMDWDRIRATDLMVLFNSFLPQGGLIKSITIYPSDFGLERMKEEEMHGPPELRGKAVDDYNDEDMPREEDENEEGNHYHMEKLRQYQLNRLKYFYAVIECDSEATANKLYTECDGLEYESSASRLDLRFIPDDMTFDYEPREVCDSLPELTKYKPRFFTTTALQQSKVQLTWDETNPERTEIAQKLMSGEVDHAELRTYLATSSSDDADEHENDHLKEKIISDQDDEPDNETEKSDPISKYKAILKGIEEEEERKKNRDVEMEISWGIGLKDKAEKLAKKKMKEQEELTPFQQYLEKRKEKKKERKLMKKKLAEENEENPYSDDDIPSDIDMSDPYFREEFEKVPRKMKKQKVKKELEENEENNNQAELELLFLNAPESKNHFNFKAIQEQEMEDKKKKKKTRKKKRQKEEAVADTHDDSFEVNVRDDRFSALFNSHHFNIDPADPHYRASKGMELLQAEKLKRRQDEDDHSLEPHGKTAKSSSETMKKEAYVANLVKKVRSQTNYMNKKI